jgi:hypothetical protein
LQASDGAGTHEIVKMYYESIPILLETELKELLPYGDHKFQISMIHGVEGVTLELFCSGCYSIDSLGVNYRSATAGWTKRLILKFRSFVTKHYEKVLPNCEENRRIRFVSGVMEL